MSAGRGGAGPRFCGRVGGGGERGAASGQSPPWVGGKWGRVPRGTAGARSCGVHGSRLRFYGRAAGAGPGPQLGGGCAGWSAAPGMAAPAAPWCRRAGLGPGALFRRCIQALGTWGQRVERCSRVQHPC